MTFTFSVVETFPPSHTSWWQPRTVPSRKYGALHPSVMTARCGSKLWKKTRSSRPVLRGGADAEEELCIRMYI